MERSIVETPTETHPAVPFSHQPAVACAHCHTHFPPSVNPTRDAGWTCRMCTEFGHTAPCAHRAQPPADVKCTLCKATNADSYVPFTDGMGEQVSNKWLCLSCADARSPFDFPDSHWEEMARQEEALYWSSLDLATRFADYVEKQVELAEAEYASTDDVTAVIS